MAYTQTDLITQVLEDLGALGVGETAASEDSTAIQNRVSAVLEQLAADNICYIGDREDIDDALFSRLVDYMVELLAPKFGRTRDENALELAAYRLRRTARMNVVIQPLEHAAALKRRRPYGSGTYSF